MNGNEWSMKNDDYASTILDKLFLHGINIKDKLYIDNSLVLHGHGNTLEPITLALTNHKIKLVDSLINYGVDVNSMDSYGMTLLMRAVNLNNIDMVTMLLKYGADKTIINNRGYIAEDYTSSIDVKSLLKI